MAATSSKPFSIYAKTLTGLNAEIETSATETIGELKAKIQEKLGLSVPISRLVYTSKELADNDKTVEDYGISMEAIVIAVTAFGKPSHFFFALDESGSMSGKRWQALIESFSDFMEARQKEMKEKGTVSKDRVSVFFHHTTCRFANYHNGVDAPRPFDNIPLSEVGPTSLVNDFQGGGNNFETALRFIHPHLQKAKDSYLPIVIFMTDGGDCGDGGPGGDFRQRAYNCMAEIKSEIPDLRVYVTVVYTTSPDDIECAKKLCIAGGSDLETYFTHLEEDEGNYPSDFHDYPIYASSPAPTPEASSFWSAPLSFVSSLFSSSSATSPTPPPIYSSSSSSSHPRTGYTAKKKMADQWEHDYQCNSSMD